MKWEWRPSISEGRRARVVTEIESSSPQPPSSAMARVSVVLPAPEGEDRIRIRPRRPTGSRGFAFVPVIFVSTSLLDVLNLLAELLHDGLQVESDPRQADVVRLRAQGIGLAPEFLGQEIEAPANGAPGRDQLARGGEGRPQ